MTWLPAPTPETPTPAAVPVLIALLRCEAIDGRATVRSVGEIAGRCAATTFRHLEHLTDLGFVTQTPGQHATLRSTVAIVVGPWVRRP